MITKISYGEATGSVPEVLIDRISGLNATCLLLNRVFDEDMLNKAAMLEEAIWEKSGYNEAGSIADYRKYRNQSRTFAVFHDSGECLGVSRVFEGGPELPPFLADDRLVISDDDIRDGLEEACRQGEVEELATAAVLPEVPLGTASIAMWRLAYRDAIQRGIKGWSIIMEPRRVAAMNRRYGFCFEQLGPEVFYQGGDCAVHLMDLIKVREHMQISNPDAYRWFVEEPLKR